LTALKIVIIVTAMVSCKFNVLGAGSTLHRVLFGGNERNDELTSFLVIILQSKWVCNVALLVIYCCLMCVVGMILI